MARVEQSIEILAPVHDVYEQLTQFEQFPSFVEGVQQIQRLDSGKLHWKIKTGGLDMEWDTEMMAQVPDRSIVWRTVREPHFQAKVELEPLEPERTRATLMIDYDPKHELVMQYDDAQSAIGSQVENDLARFKKFVETLPRRHAAWQSRPNDPRAQAAQGQGASQAPGREGEGQQAEAQGRGTSASGAEASREELPHPPWISNLMQAWSEPLGMMRRMSEEMDQLVGRIFTRSPYPRTRPASSAEWMPAVEVAQTEDRLVISAELPGVKKDDVHVEVKNDRITIEGDRRPQQEGAAQQLHRSERSYGHFYRVIALPEGAEPQGTSATMHNGLLEITVPVPEGGKRGRRVDIQAP